MALPEPLQQLAPELGVAVREACRLAGGGDRRRERAEARLVRVQPRDAREPEVPRQRCGGDPGLVARDARVDEALDVRRSARRS